MKKNNLVGYFFYDENGYKITVKRVLFNEWCVVFSEEKEEPYLLPLEFILAIKNEQ